MFADSGGKVSSETVDAIDAARPDGEEMYLQRSVHNYILRMYGNGFLKNGFVVYTREYSRYVGMDRCSIAFGNSFTRSTAYA